MLSITLFGTPQILSDGIPAEVARRKSRLLAFYLAAHNGPIARARLLTLFWPDHDRSAAQQSLRTTIHGLRRVLNTTLQITDTELAIAPETPVDARTLQATLNGTADEDRLAFAVGLYRGSFLAEIEIFENPELEDWINAERERYQRMVVRGMTQLAELRSARRDYPAALEALSQALTLDPLQENLQRLAMRTEYLAGERAAAIRRYEQFSSLLDNQLGVPPMAETRALYDAIITDSIAPAREPRPHEIRNTINQRQPPAPAPQAVRELPFVGREQELNALQELQGSAKLLLIEGEPGIGKSYLAEQFLRISGALGMAGAAHELEQALPYHPVIEAMRGLLAHPDWPVYSQNLNLAPVWRAELARLLPELAPVELIPAAADEIRLWEAISQLLQALARHWPVVVFLDDIQWADTATLGLLGYLARRTNSAPLTLLAAARPATPRSSFATLIQTLTREGRLIRIPLSRLGHTEIFALAQAISPNLPAPLAEWLEQAGEGNPYITVELVRHAHERHLFGPNGTFIPSTYSAGPIVPQTVESLIQSRLKRLSDSARLLLDLAVAAGREFAFETVARASELPDTTVLDGLDELRAARLVEPLPDGHWRFDHSLTMEVAYHEAGEPRHRRMHQSVAEALEQLHIHTIDQIAGTIAWHLSEAGVPQRAAPFALTAARRATALAAWQEAIGFYRLALAEAPPEQKLTITLELGEALLHIGEAAASDVYREAIQLARAAGNLVLLDTARLALGQSLIQTARYSEIVALVQEVRQHGHPGSAVQAELLWGIALSVEGADLCAAYEHLLIAEHLSDPQANPATHSNIVFELGNVRAQQGDLTAAIELYQRALTYAERDPSAIRARILAHNNLAYHMHLLGDPQAAEHVQIGMRLAQEAGILALQPYLRSTAGEIALARHDLDTAEYELGEGLALAERLNVAERVAGLTANLGLVALQRGQPTLAVHRLSSAQAQADALGLPHLATQIRIWLTPLLPPTEARTTLAAARAIAESGGRQRLLADIAHLETTLAATHAAELVISR